MRPFLIPAVALMLCTLGGCDAQPSPPATTEASLPAPAFTEDFESGHLDKTIWTGQLTGSNLIDIQQDHVAHGKYALRVRCPVASNKTWAFITTSNVPAALREHHFGRAYMLISPKAPARHTIFVMAGTPGFPHNKFQEIATANGHWQLTYVDLRPNGDKEDYHSGGSLPVDRWFCLEWEVNDNPNHTTIWVDGEQILGADFISKATGATTHLVGNFTDYAFGFRLWGDALAPFDLYFDDIALDSKRLGPAAERMAK